MKKYLFFVLFAFIIISCTNNQRAKSFGGTINYKIPDGEVFINATWKENDLWVITQDANNVYMREYSDWGVLNGKIIFKK